ncbi:MAG: response regulator, partial [Myxococcales bacterium]|nr:response regulator [Myxococcales bacterium]
MPKQLLLLVEREAKTRRLLKVNLEQAGFAVATARDGEDALRKLELSRPELVLVATDLPKLDGYGFVRRIKDNSEWATLPIIFMIAAESIEDKIRGLELGVEDYLTKPVFVKELVSRVQVLLAKKVSLHLSQSAANTRVAGSLSDLPPIDLLESLEHGQQSGRVRMTWDDRVGEVIFEDGEIIDAHLKRLRGEEVVFRLLCWTEGSFEVEIGDTESDRVIESGTRALIEAGMRHAAEYNRLLEQLPSTDSVLTVDRGALQDRLGKVPEELEGMVTLLDGRRTILDVIDDSPFDDISTLQTMVRLRSEGLLRAVPGVGDIPTIPGPPRTPTPPEQAEARRIYEAPEGEDDAPTLRPPAVAEVTGARVAHVLPAEGDAPAREALTLDPASQRLAADTGITTPRRGSEVGDPGAFGEDDLDDGLDEEPSGEESGEISDEISGEGPISEAPVTPRGHNAPRSAGLPATGPKSVPPPTEDVDAAFQAVLSEIQSEPPPADHRVAPELAEAVVDAAPPPDEDDFERSFQAALAEPSAEEEEEEAAEEEA